MRIEPAHPVAQNNSSAGHGQTGSEQTALRDGYGNQIALGVRGGGVDRAMRSRAGARIRQTTPPHALQHDRQLMPVFRVAFRDVWHLVQRRKNAEPAVWRNGGINLRVSI